MSLSSFLTKKFLKTLFFPAHIRGEALPKKIKNLLKNPPGIWDLPELPEIGTPLSKTGLIAKSQKKLSDKFKTKGCFFGVNGASGLIQSALISMANPGEAVLMPRNVHISVIKTCAMQNIIPVFFDLEFSSVTGHYKPLTREWLEKVFKKLNLKNLILVGHSQGCLEILEYAFKYKERLKKLVFVGGSNKMPVHPDLIAVSYTHLTLPTKRIV